MPCTFVCLVPVVVGTWPAIMSFVAGAVGVLGLTAVSSVRKSEVDVEAQTKEVELEIGSVQGGYTGQEQQFIKDDVTLTIKSDELGRLVLCAKGDVPKEHLREKAMTFAGKIQQAYAYHKAMTQLRTLGFNVVDERVGQDQHVKLRRF
jgi:hypothetical protein